MACGVGAGGLLKWLSRVLGWGRTAGAGWHNYGRMNPQQLEAAILNSIDRAGTDDWLPCSIRDLRYRMKEIDNDVANATINSIAEAILSLTQEGTLLLGKREHGGKRLPFDFQKQVDQGYVATFFARDSFELKLSHQGGKVAQNEESKPADESDDRKFASTCY
jgi:hypothetical protein